MDQSNTPSSSVDGSTFPYVIGIDIGSQTCSLCGLKLDKSQVIKPTEFANDPTGFAHLLTKVAQLGVPADQILIGLEATSRDARKSVSFSARAGISTVFAAPTSNTSVCPTTWLARENGPLGCVDYCSCLTRDGEARRGYVPSELIATYRELVRLHSQLSDEVARYKNEIHALLVVLFPEFSQVFADPTRPTALALLKQYPSAQAMAAAGVETIAAKLREVAPRNYGRKTAEQVVTLARHSVSSGVAASARATSLKILCDQLEHTQSNLMHLEDEIDKLMEADQGSKGLRSVPEFGRKMVAVLRAELGDVSRFQRADQVVAYAGMDVEVKESGKWKGQAKLSKRGSGRIRRLLYMTAVRCIRLTESAFGKYYHRLMARGMQKREALMAVMRKMLAVSGLSTFENAGDL